jgi:hypothetical protein
MGRPTIGLERNEALRRLVRELRDADFGGNLTQTARAVGVSTPTLSDFLAAKKGAGEKITEGLERHLRRSRDQMTAVGGDLAALRGAPPAPTPLREVRFVDLPNWSSLLTAARPMRPTHEAWVWERLATARVWLEGPVTPSLVADLADVVVRHVAPPSTA